MLDLSKVKTKKVISCAFTEYIGISTLKGKSYCDRYNDANNEYDPTAVIKMKSKRLSKFLGP